jgi:hypothetical protein
MISSSTNTTNWLERRRKRALHAILSSLYVLYSDEQAGPFSINARFAFLGIRDAIKQLEDAGLLELPEPSLSGRIKSRRDQNCRSRRSDRAFRSPTTTSTNNKGIS